LYAFEGRCAELLRGIREAAELDVLKAEFSEIPYGCDDPDSVFEDIAEYGGLPLSGRVREYFFRFGSVKGCWRLQGDDSSLVGEFAVAHILVTVGNLRLDMVWKRGRVEELRPGRTFLPTARRTRAWAGAGLSSRRATGGVRCRGS
jgi:hypothetical protein